MCFTRVASVNLKKWKLKITENSEMPDKVADAPAYLLCGILQHLKNPTISMLVVDALFVWHFTVFSVFEFPLFQVDPSLNIT